MEKRLKCGLAIAGIWGAAWCAQAADDDYVESQSFTSTVAVAFSGATATVVNNAGSGVTCLQDGASLAITSTVAGVEYLVSGAATNASLRIGSSRPLKLTLNGVNLASATNPAIGVWTSNRCYVVLAKGTTNVLADGTVNAAGGAFYGSGPLIFSGPGFLSVSGTKKHGISGAGAVRIRDGEFAVPRAASDAIHAGSFRLDNGTLALAAYGDGVDAGTVQIAGGALSILSVSNDTKAIKCDGAMTVAGGLVNATVRGAQGKGIKAADLTLDGGALLFQLSGAAVLTTVTNAITNGTTVTTNVYVDPSYCAAVKCDSNVTINAGAITVTHSGTAGKGLSADGDVTINGGTLDLYTTGGNSATFTNDEGVLDVAAADCLKADGALRILGGWIRAISTGAAGDAISADGEAIIGVAGVTNVPYVEAATRGARVYLYGSGESAEYSNPKTFSAQGNVTVNGGTFRATTQNDGGEGLESKNVLTINGGDLDVVCYDDCLNAASNLVINGGRLYCYSTGNDAIDSNGPMAINGGTIVASGTTAPEEGFDCDQNTFAIRGGTLVGTGGASSTPTSSSCTQRAVLYGAAGASGAVVRVATGGNDVLVYKIPRTYSGGGGGPGGGTASMTMLFSLPSLTNATYAIVTNATVSGGAEFHGLYVGATVAGGKTSKTFTASAMVTTVN